MAPSWPTWRHLGCAGWGSTGAAQGPEGPGTCLCLGAGRGVRGWPTTSVSSPSAHLEVRGAREGARRLRAAWAAEGVDGLRTPGRPCGGWGKAGEAPASQEPGTGLPGGGFPAAADVGEPEEQELLLSRGCCQLASCQRPRPEFCPDFLWPRAPSENIILLSV